MGLVIIIIIIIIIRWGVGLVANRGPRWRRDFPRGGSGELVVVGLTFTIILSPCQQDFKDTFAMNITKLAQERGEAIYATVKKKKSVSFKERNMTSFIRAS